MRIKVFDRNNDNLASFKGYFFGISDKPQLSRATGLFQPSVNYETSRGSAFKKQAHGDITNHLCTEDHLDPSLLLRFGARSILRRHESSLTLSDRDPDEFYSRTLTYPYRIQAV
jgi:hypothetical protein